MNMIKNRNLQNPHTCNHYSIVTAKLLISGTTVGRLCDNIHFCARSRSLYVVRPSVICL